MLKKIYNFVVPDALKWQIRKRSPYYQRFQEIQKQADAAAAEYRIQLENARQEKDSCQSVIAAKEQDISRLNAECQAQLSAQAQEIVRLNAEYQAHAAAAHQQILEKDQEIARLHGDYQEKLNAAHQETTLCKAQLNGKDQEIVRLHGDYQEKLNAAHQETTLCKAQLNGKDQEIARLNGDYQAQLAAAQQQILDKEQEISRITAEWQEKFKANHTDYQNSLKQLLRDPSIREDHLCGICGSRMQFSFSKKVMNKYDVSYFSCEHCRHVQTEKPYWLEEAYRSPLSDSDTGQIWRNERNRDIICAIAQRFMPQTPKVLEYAGGYGLLTRMLRDAGMECFWYDKYAANTFARHFEDDGERHYDVALAFEALEHFENPMQELERIFKRGNTLLFSEELLPDLCPNQWWYLCSEHGQHVNFYSMETLQYIADFFHKKLYVYGDVGMMTSLTISQEDFADTLEHVDLYARAFRESHTPLTREDMNTVIRKMEQA